MSFNWERSPIKNSPISALVTVPAGAGSIKPAIDPLVQVLSKRGAGFEILLIEEGSPSLSSELATGFPHSRLLVSEKAGHGAALRTGLAAAQHPLLFTFPATGEYEAGDLPKLLESIDRADVICGMRRGLGWVARQRASLVPYLLFGLWFRDVTCPVRLYRRSIFPRIPVQSRSGFSEVEILAKANFLGCIFDEVEIAWKPGPLTIDAGTTSDVWRVFNQPNFGPIHLDGQTSSSANGASTVADEPALPTATSSTSAKDATVS